MKKKYPYKQILKALKEEVERTKELENSVPPTRFNNLGYVACSTDPEETNGGKLIFVTGRRAKNSDTFFKTLFSEAVAVMDQDDSSYYTKEELGLCYPFVLGEMQEDSFYQIVSSTYDNFECSYEDSKYDEDYVSVFQESGQTKSSASLVLAFDNVESIAYFKNWLFANHANYLEWMMESERHDPGNITAMRWLDDVNKIRMVSGRQRKE